MTRGFPGKRDDPYRAGITTITDGVGLVMAESLRELLRRERRSADHADDHTSRMVGQGCGISGRRASRKRKGQGPDDRIPRTGDIVDLAGLCRNMPGDVLSFV